MLSQDRIAVLKKEVKALFRGSKKSNQKIADYFNELPDEAPVGTWNSCRHCPMSDYVYEHTSAREMDFLTSENCIIIDAYGANVEIELPALGKLISNHNAQAAGHMPVEARYVKEIVASYKE